MTHSRFDRGGNSKIFTVWFKDGSFLDIEARSSREAIQTICRKYNLSHTDIDVAEEKRTEERD
jgi:hypothetical protein